MNKGLSESFCNLNKYFFGMPKSFWDAKTCFTKGGRWYLVNFITLRYLDSGSWLVKSGKKSAKMKLFGSFSLKGGGGPLFPNVYVRILTKSEHFCKNQKCSLGPKTQNKPLNFFWTEASQIGGVGGVRHLGKTPKKSLFFLRGSLRLYIPIIFKLFSFSKDSQTFRNLLLIGKWK